MKNVTESRCAHSSSVLLCRLQSVYCVFYFLAPTVELFYIFKISPILVRINTFLTNLPKASIDLRIIQPRNLYPYLHNPYAHRKRRGRTKITFPRLFMTNSHSSIRETLMPTSSTRILTRLKKKVTFPRARTCSPSGACLLFSFFFLFFLGGSGLKGTEALLSLRAV